MTSPLTSPAPVLSNNQLDLLTAASELPDLSAWEFVGPCRLSHNNATWDRKLTGRWDGIGTGAIDDADRAICELAKNAEFGVRAPEISAAALDHSWLIPAVFVPTWNFLTGRTELQWWEMWHRVSDGVPAATTLLFQSNPPMCLTERLPIVPGVAGRSTGENCLPTRLFGRAAMFRKVTVGDGVALALSYESEPLDADSTVSILTVLSLVFGEDINLKAEIVTDVLGLTVSRRLFAGMHDQCHKEPKPSLDCRNEETIHAFASCFEEMVESARRLRFEQDCPIDAAIVTLLSCNEWRRDREIRDIVLALDTVVESDLFTPNDGRIVNDFAPIKADIHAAIGALPATVPSTLRTRLCDRVAEANQTSMSARRSNFWSRVGFDPGSEHETPALERRHPMSHKGFIDVEKIEDELRLRDDVWLARTLVNEAFLALLGYRGPIADYASGTNRKMRV
jgi:hypothetical protein